MHVRTVLSWLLVGTATGCILFVDAESTFSDRCRFAGDGTSACGQCVANACRARVDACCAEEACRGAVLDKLDQCSTGSNAEGCALVQYAQGSANVTQLQDCVRASCAAACAGSASADGGKPPPPRSTYTTYCTGDTKQCSCFAYDVLKNDTECSERTVTEGICCAGSGWPKLGGTCYCRKRSCVQSGTTSCSCSTSENSGSTATTCAKPSGGSCCKSVTSFSASCRCSVSSSCASSGETTVTSCTVADVGCQSDEAHVASCSQ